MNKFEQSRAMIRYMEHDSLEVAAALCVRLRMGFVFQDDAVVAQCKKFMVVEMYRDHNDDHREALRKALVRLATKIVNDLEALEAKYGDK